MEIADIIAVNKADGDNLARARRSAAELKAALGILTPESPNWSPPVLLVSGAENKGLDELWLTIASHRTALLYSGELRQKRESQAVQWMREMIEDRLRARLTGERKVASRTAALEDDVRHGRLTAMRAADEICGLIGLGSGHA